MEVRHLLFSFKGRLNRRPYFFSSSLIGALILFLSNLAPKVSENLSLLLVMATFVLVWPACAILAKRLHDLNLSAWCILLGLIPIVGLFIAVWTTLYATFIKGTTGKNRFGDDPLGGVAPQLWTVEQPA